MHTNPHPIYNTPVYHYPSYFHSDRMKEVKKESALDIWSELSVFTVVLFLPI